VRVISNYVKSKSRGSPNGFLGDAPFQLDASKNAAWTRTPNPRHVGVQVQTARRYETVHGELLLEVEAVAGGFGGFCAGTGTLLWAKVHRLETPDGDVTDEALLTGSLGVNVRDGRSCIARYSHPRRRACIKGVKVVPMELSVEEVSELQELLDAAFIDPPPSAIFCL